MNKLIPRISFRPYICKPRENKKFTLCRLYKPHKKIHSSICVRPFFVNQEKRNKFIPRPRSCLSGINYSNL